MRDVVLSLNHILLTSTEQSLVDSLQETTLGTQRIRWGIIGCGPVTEQKSAPAFNLVEGFKLEAVMRRRVALAQDFARRHQVPLVFDNAKALIEHPDIDAVYIATPPDSHCQYALEVAQSGKICALEKPMAQSYADAQLINNAFKNANIPLFVSYYRRSLPRFLKIKHWLDNSAIGEVRHVSWHISRLPTQVDLQKIENWKTDPQIAPGGYFDDVASHGLDLLIFLLGDIVEATGIATNQQALYKAPDSVSASWLHESGTTGSGHWNFGSRFREDKVEIHGQRGNITFSMIDDRELVLETDDLYETELIAHPKLVQLPHIVNIHKHLNGEIHHPSTGDTALRANWVMDQIFNRFCL